MLPVPGRGSVKVTVDEISIGGVQLMLNHSADVFMLNQTISGCRIELGSFGSITCNLEVRSLKRTPSRMLGMGCRFVGLSKANEALLARFVAQQEHKSVTSRGGLFGL
jgi:hypothetical protein